MPMPCGLRAYMDFYELQLANAASQMIPKVEGNVIVVRSVQSVKA